MNVMMVGRLVNVVMMVGGLVIAVQKLDECPHNKLHTIFQKLNDCTMYFVNTRQETVISLLCDSLLVKGEEAPCDELLDYYRTRLLCCSDSDELEHCISQGL